MKNLPKCQILPQIKVFKLILWEIFDQQLFFHKIDFHIFLFIQIFTEYLLVQNH